MFQDKNFNFTCTCMHVTVSRRLIYVWEATQSNSVWVVKNSARWFSRCGMEIDKRHFVSGDRPTDLRTMLRVATRSVERSVSLSLDIVIRGETLSEISAKRKVGEEDRRSASFIWQRTTPGTPFFPRFRPLYSRPDNLRLLIRDETTANTAFLRETKLTCEKRWFLALLFFRNYNSAGGNLVVRLLT